MKLLEIKDDEKEGYYELSASVLKFKKYSFLQFAFDIEKLTKWTEPPYIQVSSGYGKLFSLFFSVSKFGFCFDLCGRNWRHEFSYYQPKEIKNG